MSIRVSEAAVTTPYVSSVMFVVLVASPYDPETELSFKPVQPLVIVKLSLLNDVIPFTAPAPVEAAVASSILFCTSVQFAIVVGLSISAITTSPISKEVVQKPLALPAVVTAYVQPFLMLLGLDVKSGVFVEASYPP